MSVSERQRRVVEEAAEWWVILQDGASRAQREQYVDWLRESSLHVAEMLRVAQVHGALEQFQRWSTIAIGESKRGAGNVVNLPNDVRNSGAQQRSSKSQARRRFAVAAAAVLIAAAAAVVLQLGRNDGTIQTERGERREVALTDGSLVQVDPETRLRVIYEEHLRRVVLERGRALFHVAKNKERPFLVQANETSVRAVGTAFAVEKNENESLLVTVSEGTVAVFSFGTHAGAPDLTSPSGGTSPTNDSSLRGTKPSGTGTSSNRAQRDGQLALAQVSAGSSTELLVTAGQQLSVGRTGGPETVHAVDSARALAWAEGRLIFDMSSVAEAVLQFNRYNRIQIIVNDQTLARRSISGTFDAADPESFAAFIQSVAPVSVTRNDRADITIDVLH